MDNESSFGSWVRRRRKALDMTQEVLAQQVGCALDTIRKIESGARRPSRQVAERLADHLAVPDAMRQSFLQAARAELAADRLALPPTPPLRPAPSGLPHLAEPIAGLLSGTITFLCTDVAGSTQLWEQHPKGMGGALARHDTILRQMIAAHAGAVFKSSGDGVYAAFSRAADALDAAVAAQRALLVEPWGEIGQLQVRMVLHTGVAEERDGDYFGPPLNRAARLLAAGHGSQILLSRATQELVCDTLPLDLVLQDLGTHWLKDLTRPEHIFQVVAPGLPGAFPPLQTLDVRPHNLPAQLTPLIGRSAEIAAVCDRLRRDNVRLLTLTGPGGMGKTRLALQVAAELLDDFADGVWIVDLAPINDPTLVASTIAESLGVRETGEQPLIELLKAYLRPKHQLLVLDNFEQIVGAAPLIEELLVAASQLKVLLTSRTVLHLYGEHEFIVPPLAVPDPTHPAALSYLSQYDAVQLFIERAQAVKTDFTVTNANAPAVAEICHRLDGLPLAIELAAARSKLFVPEALLARLGNRLQMLTGGARTLPARQQTLRNTIGWSYDLLNTSERTLFARLSVFVGGCTLEAAEAICAAADDLEVLDGLASLVDKSLLHQVQGQDGDTRFTMMETVREYARDQLAAHPDTDAIHRRHATFYVRMAEAAEQRLRGGDQAGGITWLRQEHANLLAAVGWALEHGEAEIALRLTGALGWFWDIHGQLTEGQAWLTRALALDGVVAPAVRARALVSAGLLAADYNDPATALTRFNEALAIYQQLGDTTTAAYTLANLGRVKRFLGDYDEAQAYLADALALAQQAGDIRSISYAQYNLARATYQRGDFAAAHGLLRNSLAGFQSCRDSWGIALAHCNLGRIAYRQADYSAAEMHFAESLVRFTAINDIWGEALAHCKLGWVALVRSDHHSAQAHFAASLPAVQKVGYREGIADVLTGLALLAGAQGAWEQMVYRLSAAEVTLDTIRGALNTFEGDDYERAVASARASLTGPAFTAAWEQGRQMPLDLLLTLDRDLSALEYGAGEGA